MRGSSTARGADTLGSVVRSLRGRAMVEETGEVWALEPGISVPRIAFLISEIPGVYPSGFTTRITAQRARNSEVLSASRMRCASASEMVTVVPVASSASITSGLAPTRSVAARAASREG